MTKRNQEIDVDAGAEFEALQAAEAFKDVPTAGIQPPGHAPLHNLTISGIVTVANGQVTWREGHLEHVARQYAHSPAIARRDYLDDLTVAQNLDAEKFAALVEQARGDAE